MQARVIEIQASDKVLLDGFIFGPKKAGVLYIFLHGLGGDLFSRIDLAHELVDKDSAVMMFNNRGYGLYNRFKKIDNHEPGGYCTLMAGSIAENFQESVYDIKGAISEAGSLGYSKIVLVGHSTGCNKIAYYLSKNFNDVVVSGVFLAPMSDYAFTKKELSPKFFAQATIKAKGLVDSGREDDFLPKLYWPQLITAQRFLSLYTPDSAEEVFCFATPGKKSKTLRRIKKPILTILAEEDEYAEREVDEYSSWFKREISSGLSEFMVISKANHSFKGHEKDLKKLIVDFIKDLYKK